MVEQFLRRKNQQLSKNDRSIKQEVDEKIKDLCEKINKSDKYYTTSSCSGRILLLRDIKEKRNDVILNAWHGKITFNELKNAIENISNKGTIYLKQEPCILHIACKTLEDAQKLIDLANVKAGWKRCGIISLNRIIVELNTSERLELPIIKDEKLIVDDSYLNLIIDEANKRLVSSWEKIERFDKLVN
ncbi:MAG: hypothetical protein WC781_00900 [Candidatus Pacearchaeota archaeon]|jgi:tRNA wybutosine-synthesizing protein 3